MSVHSFLSVLDAVSLALLLFNPIYWLSTIKLTHCASKISINIRGFKDID